MKILLLTDIPPATNYTAGLVLAQACKTLPRGSIVCFGVVNPELTNLKLDPDLAWMRTELVAKPRERGWPRNRPLAGALSYVSEELRRKILVPHLVRRALQFAQREGVDAIWAVLQGQTMVEMAGQIARQAGLPLHTQVWDPLSWWLDSHQVDRWHRTRSLAEFDDVLRLSKSCATASWAMSRDYVARYGVRCVPLIACHPASDAMHPEPKLHRDDEVVIGMVGQFYAEQEWQDLVKALNAVDWVIDGRQIRIKVLGHYVPNCPIPEGRCEFFGWRPQSEAIRFLADNTDILYCPYPSVRSLDEVARLSFPSKLVTYFAAGRPVLFHGPSFSSPAQFLVERHAGLGVVGIGPAAAYNALQRLITDPELYARIARNAQNVFETEFTLDHMKTRLLDFLETTPEQLVNLGTPVAPTIEQNSAVMLPQRSMTVLNLIRGRLVHTALRIPGLRRLLLAAQRASERRKLRKEQEMERHTLSILDKLQITRQNSAAEGSELAALRERNESLLVEKTVLQTQLDGTRQAYDGLAENLHSLQRRYDTMLSSISARLSIVDWNRPATVREEGRSLSVSEQSGVVVKKYLDLLEASLTGIITSDASMSPWVEKGFNSELRFLGRDWPEHAQTMIGTARMRNIRHVIEAVIENDVAGDVLEAGVWRGGACIYMRGILFGYGQANRNVWVADSFAGLPPPDAETYPVDAGDTHHEFEQLAISLDEVKANFARYGLLDDNVRFLKGWFKDTLAPAPIEKLAVLRLDGDMYSSTVETLEALYHKVSPGGYIIVDDYILPACRKAVEEFRAKNGIDDAIQEVDGAAVFWQKSA